MKKFVTAVVIIALLGGAYYYLRTYARASLTMLEGETAVAHRGDLVVPITASGKIEPASVTQIKSEASGEVSEIPFEEGMIVENNDLIVRLDPDDEQRNVERAEAEFQRAEIALARAEISKQQAEEVGVPLAQAQLSQAEARRDIAQWDFNRVDELKKKGQEDLTEYVNEYEYKNAASRLKEAEAMVQASGADLEKAQITVQLAEKEIAAAEQALETAGKQLEDTQERLAETEVMAPLEGMILRRHVQVGEVIQSGKTSLTGGTILMEIADISDIYAVVNVDEADIGQVHKLAPPSARPGQVSSTRPSTAPATQAADEKKMVEFPEEILDKDEMVRLTVESFPEEVFYGVIERISPQSEIVAAIATFKVRIRIVSENRDKLVGLLNTQVEAQFEVRSLRDVVLVSYDAIFKDPDGDSFGVYVPGKKEGQIRPDPVFVPCKFGPDNAIDVAVLEGIDEGQVVYTQLPKKTEQEREAEEED